jgi:hypothetical protein
MRKYNKGLQGDFELKKKYLNTNNLLIHHFYRTLKELSVPSASFYTELNKKTCPNCPNDSSAVNSETSDGPCFVKLVDSLPTMLPSQSKSFKGTRCPFKVCRLHCPSGKQQLFKHLQLHAKGSILPNTFSKEWLSKIKRKISATTAAA